METFLGIVQVLAALAVTLGLFGLGVWGMRRYGPALTRRMQAARGERRMTVIETLMLDPRNRLVLVKVDDTEQLILVGSGQVLDGPGKARRP